MRAIFHRPFKKQWQKLKTAEQERFLQRLGIYLKNPHSPLLHDHLLTGKWKNYRSINVGGDLRAIYKVIEKGLIQFVAIGTHDQLYK